MQEPPYPCPSHAPSAVCFAPFDSPRSVLIPTHLSQIVSPITVRVSLVISRFRLVLLEATKGREFWICRLGASHRPVNRPRDPSETRRSHVAATHYALTLFINALSCLSHPFPSPFPSSLSSCVSLFRYAPRYHFCRLRDAPGCCERC